MVWGFGFIGPGLSSLATPIIPQPQIKQAKANKVATTNPSLGTKNFHSNSQP